MIEVSESWSGFKKSLVLIVVFFFGGMSQGKSQIFTDTIISACDSVPFMIGVPPLDGFTYSWSPQSNLSSPSESRSFVLLENNGNGETVQYIYTLNITNAMGVLEFQRQYTINVFNVFEFVVPLPAMDVCRGDTLVIEPPDGITDVLGISPSNWGSYTPSGNIQLYPLDTTQFTLSYIDSAFCSRVRYLMTVNVKPFERATILTPPTSICFGSSSDDTLLVQVAPSGGLLFGSGIVANNVFNAQVAGDGLHEVVYLYEENNCTTRDTVIFEVAGPDGVTLSGPPNLCQTDSLIALDFGLPGGGQYFLNGTLIDTFNPADFPTGSNTMTYEFNFDSVCVFTKERSFFIIPLPPKPIISSSAEGFIACEGDSIQLSTTTFPQYSWNNGESTPNLVFTENTDSIAVWFRNNLGCYSYSDTVSVEFSAPQSLSLTSPQYNNGFELSAFQSQDGSIFYTIEGGVPPYEVTMNPGMELQLSSPVDSLGAGLYEFWVKDFVGCLVYDSIRLREPAPLPEPEVPENTELLLPNSFTPNGDGFNDAYVIRGMDPNYLENQLLVFDIKRQLVFSATNYSNTWTGLSNSGERLLAGNYFVVFLSPALSNPITRTVYLKYE